MEIVAVSEHTQITPALAAAADAASVFAQAALAPATQRAYQGQLDNFQTWAIAVGAVAVPPFDPAIVAAWCSARAVEGSSFATIVQGVAALRTISKLGDQAPPQSALLASTLSGIARTIRVAQRRAPAVTPHDLRRAVSALEGPQAARDRMILTIGFGAALRVSELSALNVDDICERDEGIVVTIRASKTDQEGRGVELGIARGAHAASCAASAWRDAERPVEGYLFVSRRTGGRLLPRGVAEVIERAFSAVGVVATGHSLRAGFATAAARAGHSVPAIQRQTRHASVEVLMGYIRRGAIFEDNASAGIGT